MQKVLIFAPATARETHARGKAQALTRYPGYAILFCAIEGFDPHPHQLEGDVAAVYLPEDLSEALRERAALVAETYHKRGARIVGFAEEEPEPAQAPAPAPSKKAGKKDEA